MRDNCQDKVGNFNRKVNVLIANNSIFAKNETPAVQKWIEEDKIE